MPLKVSSLPKILQSSGSDGTPTTYPAKELAGNQDQYDKEDAGTESCGQALINRCNLGVHVATAVICMRVAANDRDSLLVALIGDCHAGREDRNDQREYACDLCESASSAEHG